MAMSSTVRTSGASGAKSGPSANGGEALLGNADDEFKVLKQLACCVRIHDRKRFYVKQMRCENRSSRNLPGDKE